MSESQVFRTNYRGAGKWRIIADFMNQVGRILNNVRGFGGTQVYVHDYGIDIRGKRGGLDISLFTFGLSAVKQSELGETRITINPGLVFVSGSIRLVPEKKDLVVNGNPAFVLLVINKRSAGATPEWQVGSAIPADSPQYSYVSFYEFRATGVDSVLALSMIHHLGNVRL